MYIRQLLFALLLFSTACTWSEEYINNGENIVKPIDRIDLRMKYETGVTTANGDGAIPTFRSDKVAKLPANWEIGLRIDIPYWWYRCNHGTSNGCYNSQAMGDSLFQILAVTPAWGRWIFAFGSKFIFPTAGNNLEIGDAKYQIVPSLAFGYDLPVLGPSSFCGLLVRHAFDVGGFAGAPQIKRTYIQPTLNVDLPARFFVTLSPELCYNWMTPGWFIPFDITLGRMVTKKLVVTMEYEVAVVRVYEEFRQLLEFRVGFFF